MQKLLAQKQNIAITFAAVAVLLAASLYSSSGKMGQNGVALLSIKELIAAGGAQTCTFTSFNVSADTQGTVYVAEGMMRGDFDSTVKSAGGGKVIKSHMIVDHNFAYVWSEVMPGMGMKMPRAMLEEQKGKQGTSPDATPLDIAEKLDYQCAPWTKNMTLLTPPRGVTFQDMSAMLRGSAPAEASYGAANDAKSAQCAACDQTGPSRAACRAALSCGK